ncbi:MAG: hypothetical protein EOP85_09275 [Verrucomicrobiaceae bacterium]|nr:MAG: hypothetical protein EOP85_09275 [Verrucomicrobiaceae bacterium]
MKKVYLFGFISGFLVALPLFVLVFNRYYVFARPFESSVRVDGLKEYFSIEQFSKANRTLENTPGGRKAVVYPTSGTSYRILWLPENNRHISEHEKSGIREIIRSDMEIQPK